MCRENTACFSGHRPQRLSWGFNESDARCAALIEKIKNRISQAADCGYTHFLCGGAIGVDILCGESVLDFKKLREDVTLEIVVPCAGQDRSWPYAARERYANLLECADSVRVLKESYTQMCMMERNRHMISRSGLLIAVFDGVYSGGTWQTIKLAMQDKIEMELLSP